MNFLQWSPRKFLSACDASGSDGEELNKYPLPYPAVLRIPSFEFACISCILYIWLLWLTSVFFLMTVNNNSNYIIYRKHIDILIFLTLLEITRDFHIDIYLFWICIVHIHTTSTFLHLHFISAYRTITFGFLKSFVPVMFCDLHSNFLPYTTKRWSYCRCRLSKSEKWFLPLKDHYPWQDQNATCSKHFAFKLLDRKSV